MDVELPIDVPQVVLDRLRAEEEACRSLARCLSPRQQEGDLQLLRRQVAQGAGIAASSGFPRRRQLRARELGPRRRTEPVEDLDRGAQFLPRASPLPRTTESGAVGQVCSGRLEEL